MIAQLDAVDPVLMDLHADNHCAEISEPNNAVVSRAFTWEYDRFDDGAIDGRPKAGFFQIKLRPDVIVLRRDYRDAWEGVVVDRFTVSVKVGGVSIRINYDGSITRDDGDSTTWVEADGGILKKTESVDAAMSADGTELSRRTPDNLTAITERGLISKGR